MTQNTEQKVRTRHEQIADLVEALSDEVWLPDHKSYCERMLMEAESRGTAEQRRKDAEGYLFYNRDTGTEYLPYHPVESGECTDAENIREATRSELLSELQGAWVSWKEDRAEKDKIAANVAALEARVKELEEALGKIEYASRKDSLSETERLESVRAVVRAALKREGDKA
ncbi:hypothetical protein HKD24_03095 [Gluconobacter sp. LMG 31484]|uniref:Ead/Ea22-like family protein n=1 Tax=Gluconobacter vitians TaxID=2728102 RepID=A0ABR9Y2N3_9PROT|nr:hypothetical protein [Gluconobacter vitians]MBF0858199.1 hypothetical protein [Gluconobacter vitians]